MQIVLLVAQIMIAIALICVVLIQRTAQDGGGLMGGGSTMGGLFTARGSANLLTHVTAILAVLFIVNSLALGFIASRQHGGHSLIDQTDTSTPLAPAATPAPAVPAAPQPPAIPAVPMSQ